MLQALFDFFYNLFTLEFPSGDMLEDTLVRVGGHDEITNYIYANGEIAQIFISHPDALFLDLPSYLALICSLISLIFIVVLCCLFVYKIIKLIGNLIR